MHMRITLNIDDNILEKASCQRQFEKEIRKASEFKVVNGVK